MNIYHVYDYTIVCIGQSFIAPTRFGDIIVRFIGFAGLYAECCAELHSGTYFIYLYILHIYLAMCTYLPYNFNTCILSTNIKHYKYNEGILYFNDKLY